jgi:AcrR family transcriptional regulator
LTLIADSEQQTQRHVGRRRGRPREVDLDRIILEAAIAELCGSSVSNLTFDGLALVTGVAKTTIYRRWPNKTHLIIDAIDLLRSNAPVVDTGNARADIEQGLDSMLQIFVSPVGRAIASVYVDRMFNPELAAAWEAKISRPHRAAFTAILHRGIANGEVKATVVVDEAESILSGTMFAVLLGHQPCVPGLVARLVAMVFDGIASDVSSERHVDSEGVACLR